MISKIESFLKELNEVYMQNKCIVLAIDGECASLKTTLAQALQQKYHAGVIHCDDFFLPPELRTSERLEEPGGNIDYIRLKKTVIDKLKNDEAIEYRPFDCHAMQFAEPVLVQNTKFIIVEGAYAMHPYLGKYYDISIFLSATEAARIQRISARGQDVERFITRWIPLENKYFQEFGIRELADWVVDTTMIQNLKEIIK